MPNIANGIRWLVLVSGVALLVILLPRSVTPKCRTQHFSANLADHADAFAEVVDRASYRLDEVTEELDRDGNVTTRAENDESARIPRGKSSRYETVWPVRETARTPPPQKQEAMQAAARKG